MKTQLQKLQLLLTTKEKNNNFVGVQNLESLQPPH